MLLCYWLAGRIYKYIYIYILVYVVAVIKSLIGA